MSMSDGSQRFQTELSLSLMTRALIKTPSPDAIHHRNWFEAPRVESVLNQRCESHQKRGLPQGSVLVNSKVSQSDFASPAFAKWYETTVAADALTNLKYAILMIIFSQLCKDKLGCLILAEPLVTPSSDLHPSLSFYPPLFPPPLSPTPSTIAIPSTSLSPSAVPVLGMIGTSSPVLRFQNKIKRLTEGVGDLELYCAFPLVFFIGCNFPGLRFRTKQSCAVVQKFVTGLKGHDSQTTFPTFE
ncbi:hypothetical protein G5I_00740 [Acromyrmex echinatior]|uniref:Uncharacterized protein n=1 Tax=Acromyrmex echinatior TaxID=103372 RepID=F4W5P2_ACREC|nr:hypothetical protein G5I_00740 [Acromyrmex echinatior]